LTRDFRVMTQRNALQAEVNVKFHRERVENKVMICCLTVTYILRAQQIKYVFAELGKVRQHIYAKLEEQNRMLDMGCPHEDATKYVVDEIKVFFKNQAETGDTTG